MFYSADWFLFLSESAMPIKGLLAGLALIFLSACDSSEPVSVSPAGPASQQASSASAPVDIATLKERYAGRELTVVDVSEIQLDGASTLSVSFSVPLEADQPFARRLHLVDQSSGKVDGAWELSDSRLELRLRHLEPERKLVLTIDPELRAITGKTLGKEYVESLTTRSLTASVGFASRGSLLPTRLAEGLPVVTLNVDRINVEFFRIDPAQLPSFLSSWQSSTSMDIWDSRRLLPMADLVYEGRFDLNPRKNTRETLMLPIAGLDVFKQPGVYFAVMRKSGQYTYSHPATLFTLSDIGVSAHRYRDRLDVFAQALEGGRALDKVQLELFSRKGELLAEAQTDGKGYARLPLSDKADVLLAHRDGQTSLLRLSAPALDLAEFDISGPKAQPLQFFVFGPRDLYRPGETVLINGLLRDMDGRAVDRQPVSVEVHRPDGQVSRTFVWEADENGLYRYELPLVDEAQTGRWQLQMSLGRSEPTLYEFLVEDFLPERMALEIKGRSEPYELDEQPRFDVVGRYLYGAPAAGNRLSGQLYVRPLREAVAALPGYQFGSVTEDDLVQNQEFAEQQLDDEGYATLIPDNRWSEARSPLQLIVQASLQESGGRPVTRRLVQSVWPAERLPGIRGLFEGERVDANGLAEFELLVADPQGNKLAVEGLTVRLIRERRDYFWTFSDSGGWRYQYNEKFLTMGEEPLDIAEGKTVKVSFPVEWGPYRLEVVDPQTGLLSSLRFWAGYRWQDNAEGGAVRPDQVKLELDRPAYQNGEVARVTVTPPAAGRGYLMVESSEGPLWWQEIEVPQEGKAFEVPIAQDWLRHDLYFSALVIRPGERKTQATPKRAVGLLHVPLNRAPRKLELTLDAPQTMRPNQALKVKVGVRTADGQIPQRAHLLLAAVDVGILNITDFKSPDPFAAFFGRKAYGADRLDVYGQLIEASGRQAGLAFGGDAEIAPGGRRPDSSVLIVAEQSQPVVFDAQGEAWISLDIPDFNGELRLMAQAWTDERFGMSEGKTLVRAPLVAELSMPRFMAGGDRTHLALDLHNLSGAEQTLDVRVTVDGQLQLLEAAPTQIQLADNQRQTLRLPVQAAGGLGHGFIKVAIDGLTLDGVADPAFEREWRLGIRPAYPAQLQHFRAVLDKKGWQLPSKVL